MMVIMIIGPNSCPVIFNFIIHDISQKSNALFQEERPAGRKASGSFPVCIDLEHDPGRGASANWELVGLHCFLRLFQQSQDFQHILIGALRWVVKVSFFHSVQMISAVFKAEQGPHPSHCAHWGKTLPVRSDAFTAARGQALGLFLTDHAHD